MFLSEPNGTSSSKAHLPKQGGIKIFNRDGKIINSIKNGSIMSCPVIESSRIIGKKWSIPIVQEIALGKFCGFNRFMSKAGNITPRILSKQLKELEDAGLIKKITKRHSNSQLTEYALTKKGLEFHKIIRELKKWSRKWDNTPENCLKIVCTECPKYNS